MGTIEPSEKKLTNKKHDEKQGLLQQEHGTPKPQESMDLPKKFVAWTYI